MCVAEHEADELLRLPKAAPVRAVRLNIEQQRHRGGVAQLPVLRMYIYIYIYTHIYRDI